MANKAIYKNVRKERFTQIGNDMLWNDDLTLQAKGLLSIFLSNSNDWEINMKEIVKRSNNGRDAHYKIVNELIKKGYFARIETKGERGFESMEYIFSDNPHDIEEAISNLESAVPQGKKVFIEYKDRTDKIKRDTTAKTLVTENGDAASYDLLTENQDAGKIVDTENQDAENEDAENQYINNTNSNNTNSNNTNDNKEEEEIKSARAQNIVYDVLYDYLTTKGIDHATAQTTIKKLIDRNIDLFSIHDMKGQFKHMMDKLTYGEVDNHNNFPLYFANGLEMRLSQTRANKQYQEEKLAEYEQAMKEKEQNESIYYNWLDEPLDES